MALSNSLFDPLTNTHFDYSSGLWKPYSENILFHSSTNPEWMIQRMYTKSQFVGHFQHIKHNGAQREVVKDYHTDDFSKFLMLRKFLQTNSVTDYEYWWISGMLFSLLRRKDYKDFKYLLKNDIDLHSGKAIYNSSFKQTNSKVYCNYLAVKTEDQVVIARLTFNIIKIIDLSEIF